MKKLIPPKGWTISVKKTKNAYNPQDGIHNYGLFCDDYGCVFVKSIANQHKVQPKKSRPKKSLGQIAYEARYDVCDWNICSFKDLWQRCGESVAKAVRRRMANK